MLSITPTTYYFFVSQANLYELMPLTAAILLGTGLNVTRPKVN